MAKHFFGDGDHDFALTLPLIEELERTVNAGVPVILAGLFADAYTVTALRQIIRLGLIGGGMDPERAEKLVATYAIHTGLLKLKIIAVFVLTDLMGNPDDEREAVASIPEAWRP